MSKVLKTLVAFSAVALVLGVAVAPAPAAAQTTAELQALIASLQSQIAALTAQLGGGSSMAVSTTFTRDLTLGSTGEDVKALQVFLNSKGYTVATTGAGAPGMESTYFGTRTQAALAAYQAANGIAPAAGYFGPKTRAAVSAAGGSTTGGSTTGGSTTGGSTSLSGGSGSINSAEFISGLNNEEVGEDEEDVEVAGLRIEADDGSDIEVTAVTLNFSKSTGATHDFRKYAADVSIWLDGEELARVDGEDFTDDNNYDKTVSLDRGGVIKAGEKGDLIVMVSGISNLDSADETDKWTVEFEGVRFRDGSGAVISDTSTGDINDGTGRTFSFESFATAADVELKARISSDTPDAQTVAADADKDTDGVELLVFTLKAEGSDIEVKDIPITFATSTGGTATRLSHIANTVYFEIDGTDYASSTAGAVASTTGDIITFDDVDFTIDEGDTVTVRVLADINDFDASFVAGDGILAKYTSTNSQYVVAEDATGEDLTDSEKTGTATGEYQNFYENGISAVFKSGSATNVVVEGNDDDYIQLVTKFDITALGENAYIPNVLTAIATTTGTTAGAPTTAQGIGYLVQVNSAAVGFASTSISAVISSSADEKTNSFEVIEDTTESFTLTVTVKNAATSILDNKSLRTILTGIGFANTDSATSDSVYISNISDFKSDYGFVSN